MQLQHDASEGRRTDVGLDVRFNSPFPSYVLLPLLFFVCLTFCVMTRYEDVEDIDTMATPRRVQQNTNDEVISYRNLSALRVCSVS